MPLTENMQYKIRNNSHLIDIIDTISRKGIPYQIILVLFDIINMFSSIDNIEEIETDRSALKTRNSNKTSTTN